MSSTLTHPLQEFIREQVNTGAVRSEQEAHAEILQAMDEIETNVILAKRKKRLNSDTVGKVLMNTEYFDKLKTRVRNGASAKE